jgi:hypothetical protein
MLPVPTVAASAVISAWKCEMSPSAFFSFRTTSASQSECQSCVNCTPRSRTVRKKPVNSRRGISRYGPQTKSVENQFRTLESDVQLLAQGLRRDAFIVVQLTAAGGALADFQQQVALQKAVDRVREASRKAAEKPVADQRVTAVLKDLTDVLEKAQDQGLSADIPAVRETLARGAGIVQHKIFRDLDDLRRIRKLLGEIQTRNSNTIIDFDEALGQALAGALGLLDEEMKP